MTPEHAAIAQATKLSDPDQLAALQDAISQSYPRLNVSERVAYMQYSQLMLRTLQEQNKWPLMSR